MSFLQRKMIAANGVRKFLESKGIPVSSRKVAHITGEFLKSKGIEYVKWNNKYKGLNTVDLINSYRVQHNWSEFATWVEENKEKLCS